MHRALQASLVLVSFTVAAGSRAAQKAPPPHHVLAEKSYSTNERREWPSDGEPALALVYDTVSTARLVPHTLKVVLGRNDPEMGIEKTVTAGGLKWCDPYAKVVPPCVVAVFDRGAFSPGEVMVAAPRHSGRPSKMVRWSDGIPAQLSTMGPMEAYGALAHAGFAFGPLRDETRLELDEFAKVWVGGPRGRQEVENAYSEGGGTGQLILLFAGDLDRDGTLDLVISTQGTPTVLLSSLRGSAPYVGKAPFEAVSGYWD